MIVYVGSVLRCSENRSCGLCVRRSQMRGPAGAAFPFSGAAAPSRAIRTRTTSSCPQCGWGHGGIATHAHDVPSYDIAIHNVDSSLCDIRGSDWYARFRRLNQTKQKGVDSGQQPRQFYATSLSPRGECF